MSARGAYGRTRPSPPTTLGGRIRTVRLKWHWSQEKLAEAVGCDQRTLSAWERDVYQPSSPALELLAALFCLSADSLRSGRGFRIPEPPAAHIAEAAIPYLALPPQPSSGVWFLDRRDGHHVELSPRQIQEVVKSARREGRPVWIVVG